MMLFDFRSAEWHFGSEMRNNPDRNSKVGFQALSGSLHRSARNTSRRRIADREFCRSPARTSCGTSQCKTKHCVGRAVRPGRRGAQVISTIGIISIPLDCFWRDKYIFPVLSPLRVEALANVLDFRWVTVRFVAAAGAWVIWHAPR